MNWNKLLDYANSMLNDWNKIKKIVEPYIMNIDMISSDCVLLIGIRGAGKSSICNLICNGPDWKESYPVSNNQNSIELATEFNKFEDYLIIDSNGYDNGVDFTVWFAELFIQLLQINNLKRLYIVFPDSRISDQTYVNMIKIFAVLFPPIHKENVYLVITKSSAALFLDMEKRKEKMKELCLNSNFNSLLNSFGITTNEVLFIDNPNPKNDNILDKSSIKREICHLNLLNTLGLKSNIKYLFKEMGDTLGDIPLINLNNSTTQKLEMTLKQKFNYIVKQIYENWDILLKIMGNYFLTLVTIVLVFKDYIFKKE